MAEAALHEDFSGGEDFAYTVRYRSKFNENRGSTVAFQNHIRPAGSDSYGPEARSVTTNKRVDETDTTIAHYYDEIDALTVDELPEIDTTTGLPVAQIASADRPISGVSPWDGELPEGTELVEVDIGQIPVEVAPEYLAWDKYDDLTTFTNLDEEPASVIEEIYSDLD